VSFRTLPVEPPLREIEPLSLFEVNDPREALENWCVEFI